MKYIQYYNKGEVTGIWIEALGTDGVTKLDGRYRISRCLEEAIIRNTKNRPAFQIREGESFSQSKPVTDILIESEVMYFL